MIVATHFVWALGNDASCSFIGAWTQLCMSNTYYFTFLAFYFLVSIRYGVQDPDFAKRYEVWLHAFCWGYPFLCTVLLLSFGYIHETEVGPYCWISKIGEDCEGTTAGGRFDCNTVKYGLISWGLVGFIYFFTFLFIIGANLSIFLYVRSFSRFGSNATSRTQKVATQSFLFVCGYILTNSWVFIIRVLDGFGYDPDDTSNMSWLFPMSVLQFFMSPMTGVLNLLIYIRPRYMRIREQNPEKSRLWALQAAHYGERKATTNRNIPTASLSSIKQRPVLPRLNLVSKDQRGKDTTTLRSTSEERGTSPSHSKNQTSIVTTKDLVRASRCGSALFVMAGESESVLSSRELQDESHVNGHIPDSCSLVKKAEVQEGNDIESQDCPED